MFWCFQAASAQYIFWHREVGKHTGRPFFVSASGLGPLLLLRVEGRQVDGKGKESDPTSRRRCLRDIYHHELAMKFEVCMVRLTKLERNQCVGPG